MSSLPEPGSPNPEAHVPYAAFQSVGYRWFFAGNLLFMLGLQLQSATIFWEVYARTEAVLDLANIGLVKVIPVMLFAIPVGQLADRWDRRKVILLSLVVFHLTSLALAVISWTKGPIVGVYGCLFVQGLAQILQQPAKAALLPRLIPRHHFANAVTWSSTGFQIALVTGPALSGIVISLWGATWSYFIAALGAVFFSCAILAVPRQSHVETATRVTVGTLFAGAAFLLRNRSLLAAISLDMFAVLLGGATGLLPVFVKDILQCGEVSYGWLRAAPGIGAILMSIVLTYLGPMRRAGIALLLAVAAFGLATIGFGFSRHVALSWALLFLTGAFDMISVVIRHSLIQLGTPDAMRGRVSAINGMFIAISNELGSWESAFVAHLFYRAGEPAFGPTVSVVGGGIGTLLVVITVALLVPELRRHDRLDSGSKP